MASGQGDSWALLHQSVDEQTKVLTEILRKARTLSGRTSIAGASSMTPDERATLNEEEQNLNELVRGAELTSENIEERLLELSDSQIYKGRRMQIDPNNPTFQPMEKQFLIEQVQIMTDIIKINHAMRNMRALVSKLSYTKRRSDMITSRQFPSNIDRNEQTKRQTNDKSIGTGTILVIGAVAAGAIYWYKFK